MAAQQEYRGVLLPVENPADITKPKVLAIMTDTDTVRLKDEAGNLIPVGDPTMLSGQQVLLDSIYYLKAIPSGKGYAYKEIKQLYKGYTYLRLQGYFIAKPMGNDPNGVPIPGLYTAFITDTGEYLVEGFNGEDSNSTGLGGYLQPKDSENAPDLPRYIYDILFVKTGEKSILPYKSFSKTLLSATRISNMDISIIDLGKGCCEVRIPDAPTGNLSVYTSSGTLIHKSSWGTNPISVTNLPTRQPILFVFKANNIQTTIKTALK